MSSVLVRNLSGILSRDLTKASSDSRSQLLGILNGATEEELAQPEILRLVFQILHKQCDLDESDILDWFGAPRAAVKGWANGKIQLHPLVSRSVISRLKEELTKRTLN